MLHRWWRSSFCVLYWQYTEFHALSSWNYKVPFTDCRIAQTGSYHFLAGGKVISGHGTLQVLFLFLCFCFLFFLFPFLLFIIVSKNKKICFRQVHLWEQCDLGPSINATSSSPFVPSCSGLLMITTYSITICHLEKHPFISFHCFIIFSSSGS